MAVDFEPLPVGPKMAALDERQRKFAWAMAYGEWNAAAAAREAGYSDVKDACKVRGYDLLHNPRILDAIEEATRSVMRALGPLAVGAATKILKDTSHPAHARMVETILDRSGHSARTEHKVTVEHTVDTKELEALAQRLALESGIPVERLLGSNRDDAMKVIEHENGSTIGNSSSLATGLPNSQSGDSC